MKLRLLLFTRCNRRCAKCCNTQWDLSKLPACWDYSGYDEVLLTGGEPMLNPELVVETVYKIRRVNPRAKVYLYTAKVDNIEDSLFVSAALDGMTVTLHRPRDIEPFNSFNKDLRMESLVFGSRSLRLNVFKGVPLRDVYTEGWTVKKNIQWIDNCPLPDDEVFMRLPGA